MLGGCRRIETVGFDRDDAIFFKVLKVDLLKKGAIDWMDKVQLGTR